MVRKRSGRLGIAEATAAILSRGRTHAADHAPPALHLSATPEKEPQYSGQRADPTARFNLDPLSRDVLVSAAEKWTARSNKTLDSAWREYSSMMYRDADGRIRITPPKAGEATVARPDFLPDGAIALGSIHNHPFVSGWNRAWAGEGYNADLVNRYLAEDMQRPSTEDWDHADAYGPDYPLFIVGPDGRLRSYRR